MFTLKLNEHGIVFQDILMTSEHFELHSGTAMDALNSMQNFLRSRPKTFKSLENAIEWRYD